MQRLESIGGIERRAAALLPYGHIVMITRGQKKKHTAEGAEDLQSIALRSNWRRPKNVKNNENPTRPPKMPQSGM